MAFYLPVVLNAGAFFGCQVLGNVSDRILGVFNTLTLTACCTAGVAFAWIGVQNNAGIVAWTAAYGFLSGGIQALFSPCVAWLAPDPELIATWNGKRQQEVVIKFSNLTTLSRYKYVCTLVSSAWCTSNSW